MDVKKIREALPIGGITLVAERAGVSRSLVSYVLSGKRNNKEVIEAALQVIEEKRKAEKKIMKRLESATNA